MSTAFHRHFQRLFVGGLIVFEAHRRLVGKPVDEVAAADVDRIKSERTCCFVHQPLEREGDDGSRYAAIRRHRASVRDHAARAALVLLHIVGAGHFRHGHQGLDPARRRKARIGADIADDVCSQREQLCTLVEGTLQRDVLVARMERRD